MLPFVNIEKRQSGLSRTQAVTLSEVKAMLLFGNMRLTVGNMRGARPQADFGLDRYRATA